MNKQRQNEVMAELCGWIRATDNSMKKLEQFMGVNDVPDYVSEGHWFLSAREELVFGAFEGPFVAWLYRVVHGKPPKTCSGGKEVITRAMLFSSASQQVEAILRAYGRWEEPELKPA